MCECIPWFCRGCSSVGISFWWSQHSDVSIHFVYEMEMVEISRHYKYHWKMFAALFALGISHIFSICQRNLTGFYFISNPFVCPLSLSLPLSNLFCSIKRTKTEHCTNRCTFNSISIANKQRFWQINDNFFCRQKKKITVLFIAMVFSLNRPHSSILCWLTVSYVLILSIPMLFQMIVFVAIKIGVVIDKIVSYTFRREIDFCQRCRKETKMVWLQTKNDAMHGNKNGLSNVHRKLHFQLSMYANW